MFRHTMVILEIVQLMQQWLICFAVNMPWERGKLLFIVTFSSNLVCLAFPTKVDMSETLQMFTFLANFGLCLDFSLLNLKMKVFEDLMQIPLLPWLSSHATMDFSLQLWIHYHQSL